MSGTKDKAKDAPKADDAVNNEGNGGTGMKVRKVFLVKQFLPDPDFINKNIVAKGKGTQVVLGRIFGIATGTEIRNGTLPDGRVTQNIAVRGIFQSESYLTGEVSESSSVYFPEAMAQKIAAMFANDKDLKTVQIDTDIGLEATGKTIPYAWTVSQWVEGEASNPLAQLKSSRKRPPNAIAQVKAPQLEAPK